MDRRLLIGILFTTGVLAWSAVAFAQLSASGIAGVVKDTTGAVMPGVTVEAASPALIEKVRMVITDEKGEYKIVDLRPGTYAVTFTLAGFSPVKREGVELTPNFTTTVNGEIRQQARTSELLWDVPGLIAYVSQVMTLLPGDVLLTGTPAGVGPLTDGDEVSVTIESIGTLTNRVVIGD